MVVKAFSTMVVRASDISVRSSTFSSARVISAISRSSCCSRFRVQAVPPLPAERLVACAYLRIHRNSSWDYVRHKLCALRTTRRAWVRRPGRVHPVRCRNAAIGRPGEHRNFSSAFFGALLLALAIWVKPIVAPGAAVLLGGAGIAALYCGNGRGSWAWTGFIPVFLMALHNWIYGHVFVLFWSNADHSAVLVMPPSAYAALHASRLDLMANFWDASSGKSRWLTGPAESLATIP